MTANRGYEISDPTYQQTRKRETKQLKHMKEGFEKLPIHDISMFNLECYFRVFNLQTRLERTETYLYLGSPPSSVVLHGKPMNSPL
jgi:hypothetical protein